MFKIAKKRLTRSVQYILGVSQPRTLRRRLAKFTGAASSASSAELSAALGAPPPPPPPPPAFQPITGYTLCSGVSPPNPQLLTVSLEEHSASGTCPVPTPPVPAVADVSDRDEAKSEEDQDAISIAASWDRDSLEQQETVVKEVTQETGPSSEVTSETKAAGSTPCTCPSSDSGTCPVPTPPVPAVADVSDRDEAKSEEDQDAISIVASWDRDSLEQQETVVKEVTQETGPSSEVTSETKV
ncbi:UNVERIFIED_CONTAM: hypothetical protein FKN15_012048 [Acipenser sinensis]